MRYLTLIIIFALGTACNNDPLTEQGITENLDTSKSSSCLDLPNDGKLLEYLQGPGQCQYPESIKVDGTDYDINIEDAYAALEYAAAEQFYQATSSICFEGCSLMEYIETMPKVHGFITAENKRYQSAKPCTPDDCSYDPIDLTKVGKTHLINDLLHLVSRNGVSFAENGEVNNELFVDFLAN